MKIKVIVHEAEEGCLSVDVAESNLDSGNCVIGRVP